DAEARRCGGGGEAAAEERGCVSHPWPARGPAAAGSKGGSCSGALTCPCVEAALGHGGAEAVVAGGRAAWRRGQGGPERRRPAQEASTEPAVRPWWPSSLPRHHLELCCAELGRI